jgi:hypothetical protein
METKFFQEIIRGYQKHITQLKNNFVDNQNTPAPIGGLSLLEDDSLEEKIAITNLVTKAQHRFLEHLTALAYRYGYLLGGIKLEKEQQPLSPKLICDAFREATSECDTSIQVKLILFKLLDQYLMADLGDMYLEINNFLAKQGIFPDYKLDLRANIKNLGDNRQRRHSVVAKEGSDNPMHPEQNFETMSSLLAAGRQQGGYAGGGSYLQNGGAINYLPEDIVHALNQLQTQATTSQMGSAIDSQELANVIIAKLRQTAGAVDNGTISQHDADAIDVVAMIFDFIYEDQTLSDRLKSIVGRLQIPCIKVAIIDKTFFSQKSHPARTLLNAFTQTGFSGNEEHVIDKVQTLVERVLNEFKDDVTLFSNLLAEFETFLEAEQTRFLAQEQTHIREAEIQEQQARIRLLVTQEIDQRIAGNALSPAIEELLNEAWKDLLVSIYLEHGFDSTEWQLALDISDDLLWSLTPKTTCEERQQLSKMIPRLLNMLRKSLEKISWEQIKIEKLFQEMEAYHLSSLRGEALNDRHFADDEPKPSHSPATPAAQTGEAATNDHLAQHILTKLQGIEHEEIILDEFGPHYINHHDNSSIVEIDDDLSNDDLDYTGNNDEENDYYNQLINDIQVGDWVEFLDNPNKLQRAKLVWKGAVENKLIFSNWRNEVIKECAGHELAEMMRRWDARLLVNQPIMDKALFSVMKYLKGTTTNA